MGEIAVIHMDLGSKGGGEAVAMNVLEALQADHELTLITLAEPDLDELNEFFGTQVEELAIERAGWLGPLLYERYGLQYYVLENALLGRHARRRAGDFDLLVSTINELALPADAVQYVHFPFDWAVRLDNREDIFHPTVEEDSLHERLASEIADVDPDEMNETRILANSAWTAKAVEGAYGERPEVLHPPVDTRPFEQRAWEEREDGFVTIGRVEKSKRLVELIEITDGVREHGHDVHLHIVGPTVDEAYRRTVEAMADEREHVLFEGEVERQRLVELACNHKYGLHGKQFEHFGMAVAEIAAAGAIPFVPANGGQRAIVADEKHLLWEDTKEAVEKIVRVREDEGLQRKLRGPLGPEAIRRRFGRDRFQRQFRAIVEERLEGAHDPGPDVVARPSTASLTEAEHSS